MKLLTIIVDKVSLKSGIKPTVKKKILNAEIWRKKTLPKVGSID